MKRKYKVLGGIGSTGLFVGLFLLGDLNRFVQTLIGTDGSLFAFAVIVFLGSYPLVTARWYVLNQTLDAPLSLLMSFEITAISYGLNKLLPANSGDMARSKITEQYTTVESHGELLGLVVVERLADIGAISLVLALSASAVSIAPSVRKLAIALLAGILVVGGLLYRVPALFIWVVTSIPVLERVQTELQRGLRITRKLSMRQLSLVVCLSLVRWGTMVLVFWVLAASLSVNLSIAVTALVPTAMSLAAILPLSPGGIGPVDAVGVGTLLASGVPYEAALSLIILQRSLGLGLMAIIGSLLFYYRLLVQSPTARSESVSGHKG
jgi:uncharacterized protein (TIRG00374 family)